MPTTKSGPHQVQLKAHSHRKFSHVRAAGADALVRFVRKDETLPPAVKARVDAWGISRWYPVKGGFMLKCPYQGQSFDPDHIQIEDGGWDHEHCDVCSATINVGVGCWITRRGRFIVLCEKCHRRVLRMIKG